MTAPQIEREGAKDIEKKETQKKQNKKVPFHNDFETGKKST